LSREFGGAAEMRDPPQSVPAVWFDCRRKCLHIELLRVSLGNSLEVVVGERLRESNDGNREKSEVAIRSL
jgi:hypothetical protein